MRRLLRAAIPISVVLARAHRRDVRRVRERVFADLDGTTPEAAPILVFSMGKVASGSVAQSIRAAGLEQPLYHLHHIATETNQQVKRRLRRLGYRQSPDHHIPLAVRKYIEARSISFPWKIITLVREPVGRQLSGYFQMPELAVESTIDELGRFKPVETLAHLESRLSKISAFTYFSTWFDTELKGVFGVDVFSSPFDKAAGYAVYRSAKAEVLVMTLESLDSVFGEVVPTFLGIEKPLPFLTMNERSNTLDGHTYRWVKERFRLPKDTLARIYSLPAVTRFYDDDVIEEWMQYWSRPR